MYINLNISSDQLFVKWTYFYIWKDVVVNTFKKLKNENAI